MGILDTHIALDIAVQKMDSNIFDNLKSEEKDWALNRAQLQFIRDHYNQMSDRFRKGFEDTQTVTDYMQPFLATTAFTAYVSDSRNACYFALPSDYLFHVNTEIEVYADPCEDTTAGTFSESDVVSCLPFDPATAFERNGATSFENFDIRFQGDGSSIFSQSFRDKLPYYSFPDDYPNLIADAVADNKNLYWESYKTKYKPGCFLFVYHDSTLIYEITIGGDPNTIEGNTEQVDTTYFFKEGGLDPNWYEGRIGEQGNLRAALNHAFKRTRYDSPLCGFNDNYFHIYYDGFQPLRGYFHYIRQPRKPSYSAGVNLEVRHNAADIVVQSAANYLLHLFQSPLYKTGQQEYKQSL